MRQPKEKPKSEKFKRFEDLTRNILSVPKSEADKVKQNVYAWPASTR